jgi:dienelactone hydrolase
LPPTEQARVVRSWLTALLATLVLTTSAAAETVTFRSATWPPTPLQQRLAKTAGQTIAEQASTTIRGELYLPPGNGPFPAVVLMPPCTGRLPIKVERADGERYNALGYALLTVDSFGPRGFEDGCSGVGSSVDLVMDAYGALLYLAELPVIDAERIAIVGYSKGADTALSAVGFDGVERLFDRQFRAAVAYYPFCQKQEATAVAVPTLILIGERDDWNFARDCRDMVARRRDFSAPMRLVVYPEAQHSFNLKLPPRSHYGHHLEYSEAADRAAWSETVSALRQAFGR